jgi:starvation-inducible outer membrane lipoprotein
MKELAIIFVSIFLSNCADPPVFPPEVLANVDHNLTFKMVNASPSSYKGSRVEFGGQIVGSRVDGQSIHILVRELPIRTEPVYGPTNTEKSRGLFAVDYQGEMTGQDLQEGNMLVVVGTLLGAVRETITGFEVRRPTVQAECIHIWRTQGHQIDDFPWLPTARYWPLVQQTFCINTPATLLELS